MGDTALDGAVASIISRRMEVFGDGPVERHGSVGQAER